MKEEHSWKPLYYMCELHRKGGNRVIAKNYCNQSLQVDPNAPGPLHALGLFSFGENIQLYCVWMGRHSRKACKSMEVSRAKEMFSIYYDLEALLSLH